ncbi:MAG TPA: prepilin-type N-terminal cleavage/methylation domain-containing protein [Terriglobales bacterium]|nr:prepilin-type N-terminal cleavage/methylation domain-containing protein [Terriglobales bacterium]
MPSRRMRGFSLIEMITTVTLILIVTGIVVAGLQPAIRYSRVNNAYNITLAAIRQTRDYAVAQRQQYSVTFSNALVPNTITITQAGNGNVVATYQLPSDLRFMVVGGFPNSAATVPDGFGNGAVPIAFDQGIAAGNPDVIYFMPDGTGQDVNGNINNGVIYIARCIDTASSPCPTGNTLGDINTAHAITVWGATGRIRGWRLYYNSGTPYWREN